jgi:hypothetical protein
MMNGVTVDSLGRVYTKISAAVGVVTVGDKPADVVGALILVALLIEKQRLRNGNVDFADRRQAVMDLVGKLYDRVATSDGGNDHAHV